VCVHMIHLFPAMSAIIGATRRCGCGSHGNHPDSQPDWSREGLGMPQRRGRRSHTHTHMHTYIQIYICVRVRTATNG
jgi:hypothetical protein